MNAMQTLLEAPPSGPEWRLDPGWKKAKLGKAVYESHALRCNCRAGEARGANIKTYDENLHCVYNSAHPEELVAWLKARRRHSA